MRKNELVYRHILDSVLEKRQIKFQQKKLAEAFGISVSTVHQALQPLKRLNALKIGGRFFTILSTEKILYYWACHRNMEKELLKKYYIPKPVAYRSAVCGPEVIFGGYERLNDLFKTPPADFDIAIWYIKANEENMTELEQRLQELEADPEPRNNFFNTLIYQQDDFLKFYGGRIPYCQAFVDVFNRPDWYSKDYIKEFENYYEAILE